MCPGNLVFKAKCGQCLAANIDCDPNMTTVKPTARNPTATTTKATVTTANGLGTATKPSIRCMYSLTSLYINTKFVFVIANNWFNSLSFLHENLLLFIQVHLQHFVSENHLESMQTQTTNNNFSVASTALVKYVKPVQEIWFSKLNVVNVWKLILTVQRQQQNQQQENQRLHMGQGQLPNLLTDVSTSIYLFIAEQKTYPSTKTIDLTYLFQMKNDFHLFRPTTIILFLKRQWTVYKPRQRATIFHLYWQHWVSMPNVSGKFGVQS